ncbi:unnamed protein product [Orchesella dallaii]|uniref:Uncharacterized protein n=1 Tax=Orchesella dallaii TaxID=48710 RepID=A0ABP1QJ26_9HEXA
MASTPKRALLEMESSLKTNTPIFEGKFDRHCRSCGLKIEKAALRKFAGQKCPHCSAPVEGRKEEVRLWDPCVECDACLMCFMRYCNMCGFENVHYDEKKPSRFEAIMRSRIRSEIRAETKEEQTLMAAAEEAEEMESQKSVGDKKCQNPKGEDKPGASAQKPEAKEGKDVSAQTSQGTSQKPAGKGEKNVKAKTSLETDQQSAGKGKGKEDKTKKTDVDPNNDTDEMETDE